jgi:hypothetical protein
VPHASRGLAALFRRNELSLREKATRGCGWSAKVRHQSDSCLAESCREQNRRSRHFAQSGFFENVRIFRSFSLLMIRAYV